MRTRSCVSVRSCVLPPLVHKCGLVYNMCCVRMSVCLYTRQHNKKMAREGSNSERDVIGCLQTRSYTMHCNQHGNLHYCTANRRALVQSQFTLPIPRIVLKVPEVKTLAGQRGSVYLKCNLASSSVINIDKFSRSGIVNWQIRLAETF